MQSHKNKRQREAQAQTPNKKSRSHRSGKSNSGGSSPSRSPPKRKLRRQGTVRPSSKRIQKRTAAADSDEENHDGADPAEANLNQTDYVQGNLNQTDQNEARTNHDGATLATPDEESDNGSDEVMDDHDDDDDQGNDDDEEEERERGDDDRDANYRRHAQSPTSPVIRHQSPRSTPPTNLSVEIQYSKMLENIPVVENINELGKLSALIDRLIKLATTCPNTQARQVESRFSKGALAYLQQEAQLYERDVIDENTPIDKYIIFLQSVAKHYQYDNGTSTLDGALLSIKAKDYIDENHEINFTKCSDLLVLLGDLYRTYLGVCNPGNARNLPERPFFSCQIARKKFLAEYVEDEAQTFTDGKGS